VRAPFARRLAWPDRTSAAIGAAATAGTLVTVAAAFKVGVAGLALPLVVLAGILLIRYPGPVLVAAVGAVVFCENAGFGLLPQTRYLYNDLVKGFMPVDALLAIALVGTAAQIIQDRRPVRLPPPPLAFALGLLVLGLLSGLAVGREAGIGLGDGLLLIHGFGYLVVVPLIAANLRVSDRDLVRLLGAGVGLALVKALLGLLVVASGRGDSIDGSTLTYYEPSANWLMTVALLAIVAGALARIRMPWWVLATAPLLLAALVLSYRRSFWIGDLLGLMLVVLLGLTSGGRKVVLPAVVLVGAAIWALGGVALQSDTPLGQRVQSLSPNNIEVKPDDRYRLDERANVVHAIKQSPISGLGIGVAWQATARPLPVEVNPDHQYVHFAALFWWLKLGILGALAYAGMLVAGALMSIRAWRRSSIPAVRAFGLGSLCSMIALVVVETTATFSGSDIRFSLLIAGQLALLGTLWRREDDPAAGPVV
jgi:O-antigen ligase